jgi:hypothetical protein
VYYPLTRRLRTIEQTIRGVGLIIAALVSAVYHKGRINQHVRVQCQDASFQNSFVDGMLIDGGILNDIRQTSHGYTRIEKVAEELRPGSTVLDCVAS